MTKLENAKDILQGAIEDGKYITSKKVDKMTKKEVIVELENMIVLLRTYIHDAKLSWDDLQGSGK